MIAEGAPRALIAEHIEPQVLEVYGDGAMQWPEAIGRDLAARIEINRRDRLLLCARSDLACTRLSRVPECGTCIRPRNPRRPVSQSSRVAQMRAES